MLFPSPDSPCSALECPSSRCIQLPDGPQCHCGKNFLLITDQQNGSSSCQDIDECLIFGICSHTCTNLVGSYRCDCWPGFLLQSDNWSCAPAYESISSLIIYSTSNAFWKYTPESESDKEIIGDLNGRISSRCPGLVDWKCLRTRQCCEEDLGLHRGKAIKVPCSDQSRTGGSSRTGSSFIHRENVLD